MHACPTLLLYQVPDTQRHFSLGIALLALWQQVNSSDCVGQDTKMADAAPAKPAEKPADEAMDGDVRSNGPSEVSCHSLCPYACCIAGCKIMSVAPLC